MPASVYHIYNTNDRNTINSVYGRGFRLNLEQTINIEFISTLSGTTEYAKYIDEDGTARYLKQESFGLYKDEDGLGLRLELGDYGNLFMMYDKAGNRSVFLRKVLSGNREYWYLAEIINANGDKITITIDPNNNDNFVITNVKDGTNQQIKLGYSNRKALRNN